MKLKQDHTLILLAIRSERNQFLVFSSLLVLAGIFCCMMIGRDNLPLAICLILLGLSLVTLGFKVLYDTMQYWDEANHELIKKIKNTPKDIVWVYSTITQIAPLGIKMFSRGTLFFKLIDGQQITLSASTKSLTQISTSLNSILPHATFGFSQEREQWYMASPILLLRND